jgi:hypothetical protein
MADDTKDVKDAPNPLQADLDTAITESRAYRKRAQEAEAKIIEQGERLAKIEADQTAAAEAARTARNVNEGKFQEELDAQKASMQALIDAAKADSFKSKASLTDLLGTQALTAELAKAGCKPETIGQAAQLLANRVKVEYAEDGTPKVTVMDADGAPMYVGADPATVADLVGAWAPENKHFLPATGDDGSGRHPGGSSDTGITQASLLADPSKHKEWIDSQAPGTSTEEFGKLPRK